MRSKHERGKTRQSRHKDDYIFIVIRLVKLPPSLLNSRFPHFFFELCLQASKRVFFFIYVRPSLIGALLHRCPSMKRNALEFLAEEMECIYVAVQLLLPASGDMFLFSGAPLVLLHFSLDQCFSPPHHLPLIRGASPQRDRGGTGDT